MIGFQGWGILAKLTSGVVTPAGPGGEEVSERRLAWPHTLARSFINVDFNASSGTYSSYLNGNMIMGTGIIFIQI